MSEPEPGSSPDPDRGPPDPPEDPTAPVPNPAAPGERNGTEPAADGSETPKTMSAPARGLVRLADWLPDWLGSVRFRLTMLYSIVLFGLAAFTLAALYGLLAARLDEERVYRTYTVSTVEPAPGGFELVPTEVVAEYRTVEALANARALSLLRTYSASALALLFFTSLVIGWFVAGRVLAPIGRITAVARDIQATDLSRRIHLGGPPDELKQLADTFDAMLSRLDEAFEGQRRFIQEASHELRNPLAIIRTNLDVALADPDPDELRATAELVSRTTERMSRLVDDLMVYGRQGAPARDHIALELGALTCEAADELIAPARERSIDLVATAAPDLWMVGDRVELRQAVANLLTNAVRLTHPGSTITVEAGGDDTDVWVAVSDEGPGIDPDHHDQVFERFWRAGGTPTGDGARSGLGLAIVRQIAHSHHGEVAVSGNDSGGSTFLLHFPRHGPPVEP